MGLGMQQTMRPEMKLYLAPRMIQSMEILQLPIMALQERIQQELQENPVLELKETLPEERTAYEEDGTFNGQANEAPDAPDVSDPRKELVIDEKGGNEEDFDRLMQINQDWSDHFNEEHRPSSNRVDEEGDKKHDFEQNMPSRPQSLHDYLSDQLNFLEASPDELRLVSHVIANLADNGYLGRIDEKGQFVQVTLEEVARSYDRPVTTEEVADALHFVQKLDPPGVGARDLRECLLLQLTPETPYVDVVRALVQNHLEDIWHNRLPVIQKKTGYDIDTIQKGIEALKHLNPKPGSQFTADNIPYVVPDIVVERNEDGEYEVRLLDDWTPSVCINRRYIELYKDKAADPKAKEYLKRKIQAAQWLMESIEQRRSTLEKVTKAIIKHQRAFLDRGPEHIEPLKMQQIADLVGVHVTTVSRAVDDKWVQTPRGIFSLKRFFGGGTQTASGEEVAWETIKQKLLEIIGKEDKSEPLSDEDLVIKLSEDGYPVARRTVTKYRKMLKIPSSRQRKVWS
ncbi:MAG: RNA polymerase factor sigma-54 [Gemmataceae bacterium]|nr:RNA polymerase factor sigma-54 [Gemmataceae bacterium]